MLNDFHPQESWRIWKGHQVATMMAYSISVVRSVENAWWRCNHGIIYIYGTCVQVSTEDDKYVIEKCLLSCSSALKDVYIGTFFILQGNKYIVEKCLLPCSSALDVYIDTFFTLRGNKYVFVENCLLSCSSALDVYIDIFFFLQGNV